MNQKMIAPCVVAFLMSLYFLFLAVGIFAEPSNFVVYGICAILLIGSIIVMISVTKERINEIRSGEEDDLSQY